MVKTVKPIYICFLFISFVVLDVLANIYDWFWIFGWFDVLMHFLGGALAGATFFWIFPRFLVTFNRPLTQFFIIFTLAMGFVALVGVVWEFHELVFDIQGSVADTMEDLFNDFAGGAVAALIIFFRQRKSFIAPQPSTDA